MDNATVVEHLLAQARALNPREADNLYRVRAYRRAAEALSLLPRSIVDLLTAEGVEGLEQVPGVGKHLAWSIATLIQTDEWHTWDEKRNLSASKSPRRGNSGANADHPL